MYSVSAAMPPAKRVGSEVTAPSAPRGPIQASSVQTYSYPRSLSPLLWKKSAVSFRSCSVTAWW